MDTKQTLSRDGIDAYYDDTDIMIVDQPQDFDEPQTKRSEKLKESVRSKIELTRQKIEEQEERKVARGSGTKRPGQTL